MLVEPVATWIMYILNQSVTRVKDRAGLVAEEDAATGTGLRARMTRRPSIRVAWAPLCFSAAAADCACLPCSLVAGPCHGVDGFRFYG